MIIAASPAQQADVVDVGGLPAPEQRQHDGEATAARTPPR